VSDTDAAAPLLPARMLNEYAYCPRLAYLEWVQGEFAHSADTLDGAWKHRRVDHAVGALPPAEDLADSGSDPATPDAESVPRIHARSVHLSSEEERLTAVIDLIEGAGDGDLVNPVDYKRGAVPDVPERAWEADRVQLCAQGLILRARGYLCPSGTVYYAESRTRVSVPFDDDLVVHTRALVGECLALMDADKPPAPLADSPKCPRCSLVGICLPDETALLKEGLPEPLAERAEAPRVRRLIPAADDARPLYVVEAGAYVSKRGERIEARGRAEPGSRSRPMLAEVRLCDLSQVALFGHVQISTEAVHALLDAEIPMAYFTSGGWFHGTSSCLPSKNIELRRRQFAEAADSGACLRLARGLVAAKIENQRTLLRRNGNPSETVLRGLKDLAAAATEAASLAILLGTEGNAARMYFQNLPGMLRPRGGGAGAETPEFEFGFERRNRRPPEDPINALLSFAYAVLARDFTVACWTAGLDPYLGFFHQPRFGRPALALDLMEEFRPVIADSAVLTAVNTGVVRATDFIRRGNAVALAGEGRRRFLQAYERRMESPVTHPIFGYQISYRRVLEVQARLLGRNLLGEIERYPSFLVR
jgi:CRISPR-associated protein Cas1